MRAYLTEEFGTPGRLVEDIPQPKAAVGQILVRVAASGVNPADTKIAAGELMPAAPALPAILGMDFAGVVVAVGEGAMGFAVGDEVYGCGGGVAGRPGTLAEYVAVDARLAALKPRSLSMREAAALPLVAITAWEGLVTRAQIKPGQRVLVQAATGGVGHLAVQIARAFGAQVWATASTPEKCAIAEQLGATAIPYRTMPMEAAVTQFTAGLGFDVVYDTVGGAVLEQSASATRLYGTLISCAAWETHNLAALLGRSLSFIGIFMLLPMLTGEGLAAHGEILRRVADLVDAGKIRPVMEPRRFTLAQAGAAHDCLNSGRAIGKIVVDIETV